VLLHRIVAKLAVLRPAPRMKGSWKVPSTDVSEPARTERLLARPLRLLHAHAADAKDSMGFHLFGKVSGNHFIGMCFAYASFLLQCLLAVVSAVGPYVTRGTAAANAQVLSVAFVKLLWAGVLTVYMPSVCLLTNAVVTAQFFCEAASVLLVFAASQQGTDADADAALLVAPFYLLLLPVFLPILQKAYDGLFVNIVTACCRKRFDARAACAKVVILLLAVPSFLAGLLGIGSSAKFNVAKLSTTSKVVILSTKRGKSGRLLRTKRVVRRRADGSGLAEESESAERRRRGAAQVRKDAKEDDDDDDLGDGGGDGDDGGD